MAGLLTYNGGLLSVDGGLTDDPDCCCYYAPPPECPPCCVQIDWGVFDANGDLEITYFSVNEASVVLTIFMPTKFSRIVCHDDQVTVHWTIDPGLNAGHGKTRIRFGLAWKLLSYSPEIAADGKVYDRGLIEWGTLQSDSFFATFQFSKCYLDQSEFLAYFKVEIDDPPTISVEIDVTRCPTAGRCCDETVECENCCALLDDYIFDNGIYYRVSENGGYTLLVQVQFDGGKKICVDGGAILSIDIIPPRWNGQEIINRTSVLHPGWFRSSHNPAINPLDGELTDTSIDWGSLENYLYTLGLSLICEEDCESSKEVGTVLISIAIDGITLSLTIGISECGDMTECCCYKTCSCPESDATGVRCHWPTDADCSVIPAPDTELGGPTQVTNFTCTVTASSPVFCNGTSDTITYTQNGVSTHLIQCVLVGTKWCSLSRYRLDVPVQAASGTCLDDMTINVNFIGDPCIYNLGVNGVSAFPYWNRNFDEQVRDCFGASGSGSFVDNGVTYNYTTSFTITGAENCPCPVPVV